MREKVKCEECDGEVRLWSGKPQCWSCGHTSSAYDALFAEEIKSELAKPKSAKASAVKLKPKSAKASAVKLTDDETIRLLRRIEENTSATHFWTRVTGIPVLIGMIVGFLMAMEKCS